MVAAAPRRVSGEPSMGARRTVADLELGEIQDDRMQPTPADRGRSLPMSLVRALWRNHRLFTILVAVSLVPRVLAALAFRPGLLTADSFLYMQEAAGHPGRRSARPATHCCLEVVRLLPDPLLAITSAAAPDGTAIAAIVYWLLRYWGLPAWGASLARDPDPVRRPRDRTRVLHPAGHALRPRAHAGRRAADHQAQAEAWQCAVAGLLLAYVSGAARERAPAGRGGRGLPADQAGGWRASPPVLRRSRCRCSATLALPRRLRPVQHHQQRRDFPVVPHHELREMRDHQAAAEARTTLPGPGEARRAASPAPAWSITRDARCAHAR